MRDVPIKWLSPLQVVTDHFRRSHRLPHTRHHQINHHSGFTLRRHCSLVHLHRRIYLDSVQVGQSVSVTGRYVNMEKRSG